MPFRKNLIKRFKLANTRFEKGAAKNEVIITKRRIKKARRDFLDSVDPTQRRFEKKFIKKQRTSISLLNKKIKRLQKKENRLKK